MTQVCVSTRGLALGAILALGSAACATEATDEEDVEVGEGVDDVTGTNVDACRKGQSLPI